MVLINIQFYNTVPDHEKKHQMPIPNVLNDINRYSEYRNLVFFIQCNVFPLITLLHKDIIQRSAALSTDQWNINSAKACLSISKGNTDQSVHGCWQNLSMRLLRVRWWHREKTACGCDCVYILQTLRFFFALFFFKLPYQISSHVLHNL